MDFILNIKQMTYTHIPIRHKVVLLQPGNQ